MKKIAVYMFLTLSLLFGLGNASQGQCAMCKSNVESARSTDKGFASGLNTGILYLLAMPFLAVGTVTTVYLYHKSKHKR